MIDSLARLLLYAKTDSVKAAILLQIGEQYRDLNIDSCLSFTQRSYASSQIAKDTSKAVRTAARMVDLYAASGRFPQAIELAYKTLRLAEQSNDTMSLFWATRSVWRAYSQMLDFEKVLEYARKVKAIAESGFFKTDADKNRYALMGYMVVSAVAYEHLNRFDSALYYGKLAHKTAVYVKDTQLVAITMHNLGDIYRKQGQHEMAESFYRTSIPLSVNAKRMDVVGGAYMGIARLFRERKQWDSALYYGKKGISVYQGTTGAFSQSMLTAYSFLSDLYEKLKQIDSAYKYRGLELSLKDSLFNYEKIRQVKNIGFDEVMRLQQLEQEKKEAGERHRAQIRTLTVAGGFLILLLFSLFLYRNNRQKQKTNIVLHQQQLETERQKQKAEQALEELKAAQAQLIHQEKMASLGELTAGVAHEIKNPLNFVNNFSDLNVELIEELKQDAQSGNYSAVLQIADEIKANEQKINQHGKRADAIVKGMLQHWRSSTGQKEPSNINAIASEYLRLSYQSARSNDSSFNAVLETHFDESIGKVEIVPQDIGKVLLNLYNNSFYAVQEKKKQFNGTFEPVVMVSTKKSNGFVQITIKDNGTGIPSSIIHKIYQPFFTTKPTGKGTGLGLSLSYDIVAKGHNGEIIVKSTEGEGTEFVVTLPER